MFTRTLFACAVLLGTPLAAQAACTTGDFAITDFKPALTTTQRLVLPGALVNHCGTAAAAQIRIEVKDESGKVLQSREAWPAGTSNIAPGQSADFNLGRLFRYSPGIASYTATVINVRTW